MPVDRDEWNSFRDEMREFARDVHDAQVKSAGIMATMVERMANMSETFIEMTHKVDPMQKELAILSEDKERRQNRDNTIFGAMWITIFGAIAAVAATIVNVWKAAK